MSKISKSILVKSLAICTMVLCVVLAGNAFCESVPSDFELMEDVLADGESHNRQLIERGIIPIVENGQVRDNVPVAPVNIGNAESARIYQGIRSNVAPGFIEIRIR